MSSGPKGPSGGHDVLYSIHGALARWPCRLALLGGQPSTFGVSHDGSGTTQQDSGMKAIKQAGSADGQTSGREDGAAQTWTCNGILGENGMVWPSWYGMGCVGRARLEAKEWIA